MRSRKLGLAFLLMALLAGAGPSEVSEDLVVHEWGTFLAMGGSSTLANWLLVALLVKLSDAAGRITHEERNQQPLAAASDEPTAMVPRHAG